jgi:hypothetical protein
MPPTLIKSPSLSKTSVKPKANPRLNGNKYINFAEKVNGRCAMQGFIWGSVKAAVTGQTIMEQVMSKTVDGVVMAPDSVLEFAAISGLVTVGSLITDKVDATEYKLSENFTMDAEMVNGRLAMVGFFILSTLHFMT